MEDFGALVGCVMGVVSDILNSLGTKEREAGMAVAQIGARRKD